MEPATIAAIAGGAASLLGGLFSNKANAQAQERNTAMQREFAQMGIRWKVADAKAAGIHPLYALGASTHSYSPIAISDQLGPAMASAGQDYSRAMMAAASDRERREVEARNFMLAAEQRSDARVAQQKAEARSDAMFGMQVERNFLENQLLLEQINRLRSPGMGPGLPSGDANGPANAPRGAIKVKPSELTSRAVERSSHTAGVDPMWDSFEYAPGKFMRLPSQKAAEAWEGAGELWKTVGVPITWFINEMGMKRYRQAPAYRAPRAEPSPGSYSMDRGYQRYGVARRGM